MATTAELPIDTSATATQMMSEIFSSDVTLVSASYTGAATASGIFSSGTTIMPGILQTDGGVILSTGKATDITNSTGNTNQSASTSTNHSSAGDSQLTQLAGYTTYDAAVLQAEFIPQGDMLTMQFVFSSEEYLEYVGSGYNDVVGVWINGQLAEMTIGTGAVSIDNINTTSNSNLYIDNPAGGNNYNTEMDGMTVTLTIKAPVVPNQSNTIKIGIADAGDAVYDSNLLILGNSITTTPIANDDSITIGQGNSGVFDLLANDTPSGASLTITHINGQAVQPGDSITFNTGEVLTLNADMTVTISGHSWNTQNVFSYSIMNNTGDTDTGFVTLTTPCFTAGSLIETPDGPKLIEDIVPGDRVSTWGGSTDTVLWVGKTYRIAKGRHAPIRFSANALGCHDAIDVSPQHRVVVSSAWAELITGHPDTLVTAKHLVNNDTVSVQNDGSLVCYVHLLFSSHQIVVVNGLASESYYPGPETMHGFNAETQAELFELFPELNSLGYGECALPTAKGYEGTAISEFV